MFHIFIPGFQSNVADQNNDQPKTKTDKNNFKLAAL